jgi:hypothetical protein
MLFISHSSVDSEFAKRLAKDLRELGLEVWLDAFDIPPDADWNASIQQALGRATQLLVVWSKSSVISSEVFAEVYRAWAEGKPIIQVSVEDCKPPAHFDQKQHIDFRHDYASAFESLISFLPVLRKKQRLAELMRLLPHNPYPLLPRLRE